MIGKVKVTCTGYDPDFVPDLAELQRLRKWTQGELAQALGVSLDSVNAWFHFRRNARASIGILVKRMLDEARSEKPCAQSSPASP